MTTETIEAVSLTQIKTMPQDIGLFPLFFLGREHCVNVNTTIFFSTRTLVEFEPILHWSPCGQFTDQPHSFTKCRGNKWLGRNFKEAVRKDMHAMHASVDALPVLEKVVKM